MYIAMIEPKVIKVKRRYEIMMFIASYTIAHHNAPSTYEIAAHFRLNQKTVRAHLDKLIDEGKAVRIDGKLKLIQGEYYPPPLD